MAFYDAHFCCIGRRFLIEALSGVRVVLAMGASLKGRLTYGLLVTVREFRISRLVFFTLLNKGLA